MLAKVFSCALIGLEGAVVEVEADLNPLLDPLCHPVWGCQTLP